MLDNLAQEVSSAADKPRILVGFNIFGAEDAVGIIRAAEKRNAPALLMINRDALKAMPMESWVNMLKPMIAATPAKIGIHLDHCSDMEVVKKAIHQGFTSVMYDGSQLPVEENIRNTNLVAEEAARYHAILEGEIGSVPYADIPGRAKDIYTSEEDLRAFAEKGRADWIAVAVGQVHRLQDKNSQVNFDALERLGKCTEKPLVIHGGSGINLEDLKRMRGTRVGKINVGTALRLSFFKTLQEEMTRNPNNYDRGVLFERPIQAVELAAERMLEYLGY